MNTDFLGHQINRTESPDDIITVWVISSCVRSRLECRIVRSKKDAEEQATEMVLKLMDDYYGVKSIELTIKWNHMSLHDYESLMADNDE